MQHAHKKHKIVVIDSTHRDLKNILDSAGYEIMKVETEDELLRTAQDHSPNLIIGDFKKGDICVPGLCSRIKKDYLLRHTPIIVVTPKGEISERIEAVNGGADDYIVSPFVEEELLARVKRVICATENALDANPLTKLPGNTSIKKEIQARLSAGEEFAVYYADIDNFKIFNDRYGYERGDGAIVFTAQTLLLSLKNHELKRHQDFAGHIGGDDFVLLTHPEKIESVCQEVIRNFDQGISDHYDKGDRSRGYIIGRDRKGRTHLYPLMTISLAVAVNHEGRRFSHIAEVSQSCAEIKKYLKKFDKSNYLVERRN